MEIKLKASDLRIGNYVLKDGKLKELKICGLMDVESFPSHFSCAPLTKNRLLRYGFTKHEESSFENIKLSYWAKDCVLLFFNETPPINTYLIGYGFNIGDRYYASTSRWISSEHELQNYYHCNRGIDLQITNLSHDI